MSKKKLNEKYKLVCFNQEYINICHNNLEVYLTSSHTFQFYPVMDEGCKVGK